MNREMDVLLMLLINHIQLDTYFCGMCVNIATMSNLLEINRIEYRRLMDLIAEHQPTHTVGRGYWWKTGYKKPRIEFLTKLLKQIKDE